jgi:hypothetical protein
MNTALIATGAVPSRTFPRPTLAARFLHRARRALASSRTMRRHYSRDELAMLNERRREAERLREENFHNVALARLF